MPTEEGNKRREAAMAKYGQVLGEIFDDLDKDKSGFASIEEMWYVFTVVEKLLDNGPIVMWTSHAYLEKWIFFEALILAFSAHMTDTKQVELRSKSLQDFQFAMVSGSYHLITEKRPFCDSSISQIAFIWN